MHVTQTQRQTTTKLAVQQRAVRECGRWTSDVVIHAFIVAIHNVPFPIPSSNRKVFHELQSHRTSSKYAHARYNDVGIEAQCKLARPLILSLAPVVGSLLLSRCLHKDLTLPRFLPPFPRCTTLQTLTKRLKRWRLPSQCTVEYERLRCKR